MFIFLLTMLFAARGRSYVTGGMRCKNLLVGSPRRADTGVRPYVRIGQS